MRLYQKVFLTAWAAERVSDALTTAILLKAGAVEANRLLRSLIEATSVHHALLLWSTITILLGAALAALLPRVLAWSVERARYLTTLEKTLLQAYGIHGVSKIILTLALAIGAAGPAVNIISILTRLE